MIILNILPIDLLGNCCRHRSLNRFWALEALMHKLVLLLLVTQLELL